MIRKIVKPKIIIQILFFIFPRLSILQQHLLKRCSSLYNLFILLAINEQIWKNAQMNRDIPTWWMVQWSWTKTHPTTTANGDVSCLQCKAVRRNLQDLKRITYQLCRIFCFCKELHKTACENKMLTMFVYFRIRWRYRRVQNVICRFLWDKRYLGLSFCMIQCTARNKADVKMEDRDLTSYVAMATIMKNVLWSSEKDR